MMIGQSRIDPSARAQFTRIVLIKVMQHVMCTCYLSSGLRLAISHK